MPARRSDRSPASPDKLKRERAGTYVTADGRFTIESSSSGWLLFDAEQADELGLPLARGPFPKLDGAKAAIEPARIAPAPASDTAGRAPSGKMPPAQPKAPAKRAGGGVRKDPSSRGTRDADDREERKPLVASKREPKSAPSPPDPRRAKPPRPGRPPVVVREMRTADGDALRALWADCGFTSVGDDDRSLARLARRNPGLVLVAAEGTRVVGSALGAWDGRRGWIYHVATARTHRRQGIGKRLIAVIETGLRALGCPKVNVMVRHENDDGAAFWHALGYGPGTARQLAKELDAG